MNNSDPRTLYVNALDALLKDEIAKVVQKKDFVLLKEIARLAQQDAPTQLAVTDPSLYTSWRNAVTRFHIAGWTEMTPEKISSVIESL
ncbi:hypothetical protein [Aliikangiella sp. IMCC44359]|uniref:hypothetical protein n=1 Tax=Aliikangiella sp. IMCC44359 TaxID=3459125 RepID=UPI00403ADC6A